MNLHQAAAEVVKAVLEGYPTAVIFLSDKQKVKATRIKYRAPTPREKDIRVTIGPTDYEEKKFLKLCKKTGQTPPEIWLPKKKEKR
jgi:hypothetical protein